MKISDFWSLMDDEFGPTYSHVLAKTLYTPLGNSMTISEAIDSGVDLRELWTTICDIKDVPEERRLGRDTKNVE